MPRSNTDAKSAMAGRIKALCQHMTGSRAELARELGISQDTVARWEQGLEEPSANFYIKLGNIAGEPSCWYFWEHAGLYGGNLMRVLPAVHPEIREDKQPDLQEVHAGGGERLFSKPQLHAIPLLPLRAATSGEEGDKQIDFDCVPPQGLIAAPSDWAPHPAFTCCLRVRGNSMAPVLCDGYIIVVDTSETERAQLMDKMIVAWHADKGITVSWLKTIAGGEALVSQSDQYGPVLLNREQGWRMIGKVIWWIGRDG
jgi:transcriptional regulator with XRE-family HTH domain